MLILMRALRPQSPNDPPEGETLRLPPFRDTLPTAIYFRSAEMPPRATYPTHRHVWGEFVYSFRGVMEVRLDDHHYLAPPQYGIWLPPNVEHTGRNRREAVHCSLYVAAELCDALPRETTALVVEPVVRAMLERLWHRPPEEPQNARDERYLRVLVDLLAEARAAGSYLPTSTDPLLVPLLRAFEADPGDERSLARFAAEGGTTERTLMRRFRRDLGMTFGEWRQRLRVVRAMPLLESGAKVESVAHALGYRTSSAFIAMFRERTGMTPDEFRRG